MSPSRVTPRRRTATPLLDRLALRIAKVSAAPAPSPPTVADHDGKLSRRNVLNRAAGATVLAMIPLHLADPGAAQAEGYCAAKCLDDANALSLTRINKCIVSAFGSDIPDPKALAAYAASKIRSGGVGALVLFNELIRFDVCTLGTEIRYRNDAGKCGQPNCGDPAKYPPHTTGACQSCNPGFHCCVCRDYDGAPLPNVMVNGGYSCTDFCTTLGFTSISDTPC